MTLNIVKHIKRFICSYNKTSDAGPDTSSFSVFMSGCNLSCPYCMNGRLIRKKEEENSDILKRLKKDVDEYKPEMIFISGGEPTENPLALFGVIGVFKSWGCKIGMSTNGTNPERLEKFISEYKKINYVAMDLKGDIDTYKILGNSEYFMKVLSSWISLRKEKKNRKDSFNYEIRTTLFRPFVNEIVLRDIGRYVKTDEKWILQQFRVVPDMPSREAKKIQPYSENELNSLLKIAQKFCKNVLVRYV